MSAPKAGAPVVGFNHNVQFGPRLYHVQTEDSGLPHAHYITHLFVGGNIVASMKSSYVDLIDAEPDLPKAVRILMEAQHKAMLKRLVSGEFNDVAERVSAQHYEPGVLATGQAGPQAVNAARAPAPLRAPPPQVAQVVWVKNITRRATAIERKICVFMARDYRDEWLRIASKTESTSIQGFEGCRATHVVRWPTVRSVSPAA